MSGSSAELAPGFRVGQWTGAHTGVSVVLCPPETVGSGEVRGGSPATREIELLDPLRTVEHVDAVVFAGGSAFGLAAGDGVTAWLAEHERGLPTRGGRVPIVPTAAIYDLVGSMGERPGTTEGRTAAEAAARGEPIVTGAVGAGRGATVGKWRGPQHAVAGGVGVATTDVEGATVGALAVVNAVGDIVDAEGQVLAGSRAPESSESFPELFAAEATTLVAVTTDARCTKVECHLLAQSAHLGMAHAIRPSHTRHDGDLSVALAAGGVEVHLDRLRVAVSDVVAEAVRAAVRHHEG